MLTRSLSLALATCLFVKGTKGIDVEPCEYIATQASQGELSFPADKAFDCLNSVPVDEEGDKKLIEELKILWQWNSDITWLKNPPEDWENGPLDIVAELDQIKDNLNHFESEYQVQLAIQKITLRSGDYHFNYAPDILNVFQFTRAQGIVALSDDGVTMPKIYISSDALSVADGNITEEDISSITKFNGMDSWSYLESIAQWQQYRDTDGCLNSLWDNGDARTGGAFATSAPFDGVKTNIAFANGTSIELMNTAISAQNFTDVKDGKSFYTKFCRGEIFGTDANDKVQSISHSTHGGIGDEVVTTQSSLPVDQHRKRQIIPSHFPEPVVQDTKGAVAGYFLEGEGYDDVAVLKIITFEPEDGDMFEFQWVISKFLKECQAANKNRLILDLRQNGGGYMQLMLDLFMQLFPHRTPWQGSRFRANPHFKLIGDAVNEIYDNKTVHEYYMEMWNETLAYDLSWWYWSHYLDAQGKSWDSWEHFKGPELFHDDQYTSMTRYNLSNDDDVSIRSAGFNFTDPSGLDTPFNHTEIIMFTDALCGSACAAIHEELKNNAGVKSVTVGGRAVEGPIQAVSGTKGGEVVAATNAITYADRVRNISRTFDLKSYPADEATLDELIDTPELQRRAGNRGTRISPQLKVRKGDKTSTPLQYTYEAADCKIFYTHQSFADPEMIWKQVYDAYLEPEKHCVKGSTGHKSSISGGFVPYGPWTLKDEDMPVPQNQAANDTSDPKPAGSSEDPTSFEGAGNKVGVSIAFYLFVAVGMAAHL